MIRLKTALDFELFVEEHQGIFSQNTGVKKRIAEALKTLDEAYGADRKAHDMGGYVLLFLSEENFNAEIEKILAHHHLNREFAEYSEVIEEQNGVNENGLIWLEELYLLSSDDSILMIHPQSTTEGQRTAQKGA